MKRLIVALALLLSLSVTSPAAAADCSLAGLARDPRLASFSGYVAGAHGALWSRHGSSPRSTGSVLKLLTASAALKVLGADYRMTTRVVAGTKAGTVVLVGGGDPTISRVSNGYYPAAARLSTLAAKVKKALHGKKVTKIVVDASLWSQKDSWDTTWKRSEQRIGYLSETSALQVDGDRANPRAAVSPRSTNPARHAGRYLAKALGVPRVKIVTGTAPAGARSLGAVKSPKLSSLVRFMLLTSDGTLAESIARVTSLHAGGDGSAASLATVIPAALKYTGLDTSKLRIRDGSGLSTRNGVSAAFVSTLLARLPASVTSGLSVAGRTGSLASRFTSSPARGHIRAKTGWLDTEYSLAGIVHARDGSTERFAFYAIGAHVKPSAKVALDALATRVYVCGGRTH